MNQLIFSPLDLYSASSTIWNGQLLQPRPFTRDRNFGEAALIETSRLNTTKYFEYIDEADEEGLVKEQKNLMVTMILLIEEAMIRAYRY